MGYAKIWNLKYEIGQTGRTIGDAGNPQRRASAMLGAQQIARNGWHAWVEHAKTGVRIFDSKAAKKGGQ